MKRPVLLLAVLFAAGVYASPWSLFKGAALVQPRVIYGTVDDCIAAANKLVPGSYTCVTSVPVMVMHGGVAVDPKTLIPPVPGHTDLRVIPTSEVPQGADIGAFRTVCQFSHMAFDDPLVYPGEPNKSHLHTFLGNGGTNAYSTTQSIQTTGDSSCRGGIVNRSAYWFPTMLDDVRPMAPGTVNVYYKQEYLLSPSTLIQDMPKGLRMIAGNPQNTTSTAQYNCDLNGGLTGWHTSLSCPAGSTGLTMGITFPQCWNGQLDSPDHQSHMASPEQYRDANNNFPWRCPATHPTAIPALSLQIWYPIHDGMKLRLSSDMGVPGASSHADYIEGWMDDARASWGKNCIRAQVNCQSHLLGDGRQMVD